MRYFSLTCNSVSVSRLKLKQVSLLLWFQLFKYTITRLHCSFISHIVLLFITIKSVNFVRDIVPLSELLFSFRMIIHTCNAMHIFISDIRLVNMSCFSIL